MWRPSRGPAKSLGQDRSLRVASDLDTLETPPLPARLRNSLGPADSSQWSQRVRELIGQSERVVLGHCWGCHSWQALNASRGFKLASRGNREPKQDPEQGNIVTKSGLGQRAVNMAADTSWPPPNPGSQIKPCTVWPDLTGRSSSRGPCPCSAQLDGDFVPGGELGGQRREALPNQ